MASRDDQRDNFSASKEEFCRFGHLLYERHLAAGVGGNIAARSGNRILLTPTDYSLRDLHPDTVSVVNEKGLLMEGDKPTKEADMHLRIFRQRPDINVVFYLHGPHIIAASTMFEPGPTTLPAITPGFVYFAHPLPIIPFMAPGSRELAESVTKKLSGKKSMGVRPTQLTENRKNRLVKLFRILTCQMCRPDTHALQGNQPLLDSRFSGSDGLGDFSHGRQFLSRKTIVIK